MSSEQSTGAAGETRSTGAGAPRPAAPPARPTLFAILTLLAGGVAMSLLVWRIGKAWRIEYGSGPRDPRPIPTTGSFGAPGALPTPMKTTSPAAPGSTTSP